MPSSQAQVDRGIDDLPLVGGHVAIDFVNTCDWHDSASPHDHLVDYDALIRWSVRSGVVSAVTARRLKPQATRRATEAKGALARAKAFRQALYAAMRRIARNRAPHYADIRRINATVSDAQHTLRLTMARGRLRLIASKDLLDGIVWILAIHATSLFTTGSIDTLKQCARTGCGWFFLDGSRKRNRRWCSMDDCGNAAKQAAFQLRRRKVKRLKAIVAGRRD